MKSTRSGQTSNTSLNPNARPSRSVTMDTSVNITSQGKDANEPAIPNHTCPLCDINRGEEYFVDRRRTYLFCATCHLVFVPPTYFVSPEEEKSTYDHHQNSPEDQEYRRFLSRLFLPMHDLLGPGKHGLDFGSGPGPTLSVMFKEAGYPMATYDHFYAHNPEVLTTSYDFITATEVVEHLHAPGRVLHQIWTLLKPGGYLGLMTKLVLDRKAFANWHYKNEPTHVCFFSRPTFEWLATQWQAELQFIGKDVIVFRKIGSLS